MPAAALQGTLTAFPIDVYSLGTNDSVISGDGRITVLDIVPNSLDSTHIKNNAITAAELANNAVDTDAIIDLNVTDDKLALSTVAAGSYTLSSITVNSKGLITAASSGTAISTDVIPNWSASTAYLINQEITSVSPTTALQTLYRRTSAGTSGAGIFDATEETNWTAIATLGASGALPTRKVLIGGNSYDCFCSFTGTEPTFSGTAGVFTLAFSSNVTAINYLQIHGNSSNAFLDATVQDFKIDFVDSTATTSPNDINQVFDSAYFPDVSYIVKGATPASNNIQNFAGFVPTINHLIPATGTNRVLVSGLANFGTSGVMLVFNF